MSNKELLLFCAEFSSAKRSHADMIRVIVFDDHDVINIVDECEIPENWFRVVIRLPTLSGSEIRGWLGKTEICLGEVLSDGWRIIAMLDVRTVVGYFETQNDAVIAKLVMSDSGA